MSGKKTPIEQGVIARVSAGLRYAVSGTVPDEWFGPLRPLPEVVPQEQREAVAGRRFDFPTGYNTNIRPRAYEPITFDQLRSLADAYDILRIIIETRKDQIAALKWVIKPTDKKVKPDAKCEEVTRFLKSPDRMQSWDSWLRALLEDMLVIDAATIYPRKTLGGKLYALELVDGSTVKRVIDATGRTPEVPEVAYQQILKGLPAVDYSRDELIYAPRNIRTNRVYGFSPVEQIITTVNIAIRRQLNQLEYYTDGNVGNMLFRVPKDWQPSQIREFQEWFNELIGQNSKHKARFIPDGIDPVEVKQPPLKDMYDEWLSRVVCFAFSIEPTAFVAQVNRATAETSRDASISDGQTPIKNWVKSVIDRIINDQFGYVDIEFDWVDQRALGQKEQAEVDNVYLSNKVLTPDEVRENLGREPLTDEQREKAWPTLPAIEPNKEETPDKASADAKEAFAKRSGKPRLGAPIDQERAEIKKARSDFADAIAEYLSEKGASIAKRLVTAYSSTQKAKIIPLHSNGSDHVADDAMESFDDFIELASAHLAGVVTLGGDAALNELSLFDPETRHLVTERAKVWAADRGAEMVGRKWAGDVLIDSPDAKWRITDYVRLTLRELVAAAIEGGWSNQKLSKEVVSADAFSKKRADMIARTETAKADSQGALIGYIQSGLVAGKVWLTAHDDKVSDECVLCEEAGVIGLNEEFPTGEQAPPNHPNCRCAILPVLKDEMPALVQQEAVE